MTVASQGLRLERRHQPLIPPLPASRRQAPERDQRVEKVARRAGMKTEPPAEGVESLCRFMDWMSAIGALAPEACRALGFSERKGAYVRDLAAQLVVNPNTIARAYLDLEREGVLEKFGVEMIGANADTIDKAEDREKFKQAMTRIGLDSARKQLQWQLILCDFRR